MRSVHVGGDAGGPIVAGDHNVVVTGEHTVVTVVRHRELPPPRPREEIRLLPRELTTPVGRDDELRRCLAPGPLVQVHGEEGVGKSTLLRNAAVRADGGVVFLNAAGHDPEDLVQAVFEACFDAPGHRPSEVEVRSLMADVRVRLVVDDFTGRADDLTRLLDAAPAATAVVASTERVWWGDGDVVPLRGLPRPAGLALLADRLRRPLTDAERSVAAALWEATGGRPLDLVRVAGVAAETGALPGPADVPHLVARVVARLTDAERAVLGLFAVVPGAQIAPELVTALSGATDLARLTSLGLLLRSGPGLRLAAGVAAHVTPDDPARVATGLVSWLSTPAPARLVADHAVLVESLVGLVDPRLGTRLARAASPAAARSLRWGFWRRVLDGGAAAAQRSGDERARAYFGYEQGVRLLLTGSKLAAAAAFGAAAATWTALGDTDRAALADRAGALTDGRAPDLPEGGGDFDLTAAKPGLSAGAKLLVGATCVTAVGGGALWLAPSGEETVPLRVRVVTQSMEVALPGTAQGPCPTGGDRTDCTAVVDVVKDAEGPFEVVPSTPLPGDTRILYWGCREPAPTTTCTVKPSAEHTVCATTSSPADEAARRECEELVRREN